MRINHFAQYLLHSDSPVGKVTENELKDMAVRLRAALGAQSFKVGDIFGSSVDMWGFGVETEPCEILIDVSPLDITGDQRWCTQVMLSDPGWFKATRERRLGEMKRVEWAVHRALIERLGATDLVWFTGEGSIKEQAGTRTP